MLNIPTKLFINGKFMHGEGAPISAPNPTTGAQITQVNEASLPQIEAVVTAFKTYKKTTPAQRCC